MADSPSAVASTTASSAATSNSNPNSPLHTASAMPANPPATAAPRTSAPRFPVRIGITWKKGERLEAMDFSQTWYPSKIVEINGEDKQVLIHFEGWNQRYDEWVAMDSEKLRPITRHSERKDKAVKKRRMHSHPVYRAGEKVLAKWSDCKKYPAKINRLLEDGMYEVIFFDGVSRMIQPMNIQPMPLGMESTKTPPAEVLPEQRGKLSFKQIKLTLPESVRRIKEAQAKSKASPEGATPNKDKLLNESKILNRNKAAVLDKTKVTDEIKVQDKTKVTNEIKVQDKTKVTSESKVHDKTKVANEIKVQDKTMVTNESKVQDKTKVTNEIQEKNIATDESKILDKNEVANEIINKVTNEIKVPDKNKMMNDCRVIIKNRVRTDGNFLSKTKFLCGDKSTLSNQSAAVADETKLATGSIPAKAGQKPSCSSSSTDVLSPDPETAEAEDALSSRRRRPVSWRIRRFTKIPFKFLQAETAFPPSKMQAVRKETAEPAPDSVETAASVLPSSSVSAVATVTPVKKAVVKDVAATSLAQFEGNIETVAATSAGTELTETMSAASSITPASTGSRPIAAKRRKRRSSTHPKPHSRHKKMRSKSRDEVARASGLMKRPPKLDQGFRAKSLDSVTGAASSTSITSPPFEVFIPSKAFIVAEDHNLFKCHHQGCNKAFRKESLLAYHIKYYHAEPESAAAFPLMPPGMLQSPVGTPGVRRRRKKTNSICSTDSDISISSRGRSSGKRRRHDSEMSVTAAVAASATSPDILNRDPWSDVKPLRLSQDSTAEESAAEEEEMEADVVNCVCAQRETNGLMIQCEVCMCWQHFACVDTSNNGVPPANYVCRICEDSPGIRDSCRYMHDMGWERRGELPMLPFTPEGSTEHLKSLACECNELASALLAVKSALHSTRRQIKITKEEADPEFQLWQTDWDNWTKPEEDLTLTPRSADPEPSPTPSTFLFPPAPRSSDASAPVISLLPSSSLTTVSEEDSSFPQSSLSSESSSQNSLPSASNSTTVEIASVLDSPPVMSQPSTSLPRLVEASRLTTSPTTGVGSTTISFNPPQTLSSSRSFSLPSIQEQTQNLAKDLFSKSTEDNIRPLSGTSSNREESKADNSSGGKVNGHDTLNDVKFPSKHGSCMFNDQSSQTTRASVPSETSENSPALLVGVSSNNSIHTQTTSAVDASENLNGEQSEGGSGTNTQDQVLASHTQANHSDMTELEAPADDDDKHMTSLFVQVSGGDGGAQVGYPDDDDTLDNDTDTAEESLDPYRNCEQNLLVHISKVHSDIEKQLETLEQQISDLENSEHTNPTVQLTEDNVLNDIPALKKSLNRLSRNLVKVHRFCVKNNG